MANISKSWIAFITAVCLFLILSINEKLQSVSHLPSDSDDECISSFDTFAFTFPDLDGPTQEEIMPLPPWQVVAMVPEVSENRIGSKLEVVAIRSVGEDIEIWLSNPDLGQDVFYLVYRPDRQDWQKITPEIANSSTKVESLYLSNEQSIWGISLKANQIIFSIFDDASKRFVEQYRQKIPLDWQLSTKSQNHNLSDLGQVLWAPDGVFWIFSKDDAIYNFDLFNQQSERLSSLEEYGHFHNLVYDPNGRFYFNTLEATFQYTISTEKIAKVDLPNDTYLAGTLIDHAGNLWLSDGYGWRTPGGVWQTLHPDPIKYWWYIDFLDDWRYYSPPDPFMESSDGRIWFRIYRSNNWKTLRSGMAWFNPHTREGCWFTSEGAQILEDPQHNLWMVVGGELHKYELKP